jgi:hypothetical protein
MAPSFANMPPHARASFIAEQLERLSAESAARTANPTAAPAPSPSVTQPDPAPPPQQPKPKKARATAVTAGKNVLRAAKAVSSKSLASPSVRRSLGEGGPQFIHHPPDLARHRRKCAVCHHPDREIIEDLFIRWHSPESIVRFYNEDNDNDLTWVSIYRHAYAFGLDEIRRRNLRFVFEHLLEQADQITPTSATVIAAARALGSCVDSTGHWNEPPKRVLVTNIVKKEPHDSAPITAAPSEDAFVGADRIYRPASPSAKDSLVDAPVVVCHSELARPGGRGCDEHPTSLPAAAGNLQFANSAEPPATEALVAASRRPHFDSSTESETEGDGNSSFRAPHPRDVVRSGSPTFCPEIRNSSNSLESNDPPISNR